MIVVTGATGALGSEVIAALLTRTPASNIIALVRNPEKAVALRDKGVHIRVGDYDDPASLVHAFTGAEKLYFVSGSDIAGRQTQHRNVVEAAKAAGVGHIVYTSFDRKTEDGSSPIAFVAESHLHTEKWIRESGIPYTIMLHGLYMDMLPMFMGEKVLENGVIFQPSGKGKTAFTLRRDMAEAGAVVLTEPGHTDKTYRIVADTAHSYGDVAETLGALTGKNILHVSPGVPEFVQTLGAAGVPAEHAGFFAAFAQAIEAGEFEQTQSDLEGLIGRRPTSLKDFLKTVYAGN